MNSVYVSNMKGDKLYLYAPSEDAIDYDSIVKSLSKKFRFSGNLVTDINQSNNFYSVLDHSVLVMAITFHLKCGWQPHKTVRTALAHDFTEPFLADVPSPVKSLCVDFQVLEADLWSVIAKKYDLDGEIRGRIAEADYIAAYIEAKTFGTERLFDRFCEAGLERDREKYSRLQRQAQNLMDDGAVVRVMLDGRNKTCMESVVDFNSLWETYKK